MDAVEAWLLVSAHELRYRERHVAATHLAQ